VNEIDRERQDAFLKLGLPKETTAESVRSAGENRSAIVVAAQAMLAITRKRSFLNIRRESVVSRRPIRRGNGAKNRPQGWQTAQLHPGGVIGGQP